jgi:poly(A) polymerase
LECYVVGGYVRDIFLNRPSKDIDVVVVGSGIEIAQAFGKKLGKGAHVSVFRNFGTAQVKYRDTEVEFVGARKESYSHDSRKPVVENGTLEDDQNRRDFTINAMAVCLNQARFGELVDPFGGLDDLKERTIRTPLDPDITFSDDPLRMMRCIRFATQLNFYIEDETFFALERNKERIEIISRERIADELNKILLSPVPSKGFVELDRCGLLPLIFPESHQHLVTTDEDGTLDQHTVGGQQLQLLFLSHGGQLLFQIHGFVEKAGGIEKLLQGQSADVLPQLQLPITGIAKLNVAVFV